MQVEQELKIYQKLRRKIITEHIDKETEEHHSIHPTTQSLQVVMMYKTSQDTNQPPNPFPEKITQSHISAMHQTPSTH
jgi:hypothetical protein